MITRRTLALAVLAANLHSAHGQEALGDVHLFRSFFQDAAPARAAYLDAGLNFDNYNRYNSFLFGARGALPIAPSVELGAAWAFTSVDPDFADSRTGIADLLLNGRYNFAAENTKLAAGGYLTLPIGQEKVGAGSMDLGFYGALRHPLQRQTALTGNLGLNFLNVNDESTTSLGLAGGIIHQTNSAFSLIGEIGFQTRLNFAQLSGGVDYKTSSGGRLRGVLGLGLDDGAPDFSLGATYLHHFR